MSLYNPRKVYENVQVGFLKSGGLLAGLSFAGAVVAGIAEMKGAVIGLMVLSIVLSVGWAFSKLTTEVMESEFRMHFRFGWPGRRVDLSEITKVISVTNPWYYGFGIRLTPHGWLWNVSGTQAVEFHLASKSKFRVGTNEPEALIASLSAATNGRLGAR